MFDESAIYELVRFVSESHRLVVLSGAGMSTESGIPDFRSGSGLWQDESLVATMSDEYLIQHPKLFWPRFKQVFMRPEYLQATPNPGHLALAQWEQYGKRVTVFTQNVDGLHQQAGSTRVYNVHGSVHKATCPTCHHEYGVDYVLANDVPECHFMSVKGELCDSVLHPDTVLFGQPIRHYERALVEMAAADALLVLGTSLTVHPVATLPDYARKNGVRVAIVNADPTYADSFADIVIHAKVGETLSLVNQLWQPY